MRRKAPARASIAIEADRQVISDYGAGLIALPGYEGLQISEGDAFDILPRLCLGPDSLVYCDPPYLGAVRSAVNRVYYGREMMSSADHERLLQLLLRLPGQVMISGYWSQLYSSRLQGWRSSTKWTSNRAGKRVQEWLWMNFRQPAVLHDARFVGDSFTDRQRIKRKVARWYRRFLSMKPGERAAVWAALSSSMVAAGYGGRHGP